MKKFFFLLTCLIGNASIAHACELCAVFNSIESAIGKKKDFQVGAYYHYRFSDSPTRPEDAPDLQRQEIQSYTTQVFGRYYLNDSVSVQLNLPFTYREYRRAQDNRNVSGSEAGLGDVSVLGNYIVSRSYDDNWTYLWQVWGGLKLPTGDSDPLAEERAELTEVQLRHGGDDGNLIGGDDIALGTGSVDVLFGSAALVRYQRYHSVLDVQYALRTEGDYDYEFGDDFSWRWSSGYYAVLEHELSFATRIRLTGEYKAKDKLSGVTLDGSEEANLYLGPEFVLTLADSLVGTFGVDFALHNDDSRREVVSKYRLDSSLSYRF